MRTTETMNIGHLISALELAQDQLQDLRVKLKTEKRPELIEARLTAVTHYRNVKIGILGRIDKSHVSRREAIGLLHHN